jgi:hypothetical protein
MTNQEYLQELATLLHRLGDVWLEYAELCELQANELMTDLISNRA